MRYLQTIQKEDNIHLATTPTGKQPKRQMTGHLICHITLDQFYQAISFRNPLSISNTWTAHTSPRLRGWNKEYSIPVDVSFSGSTLWAASATVCGQVCLAMLMHPALQIQTFGQPLEPECSQCGQRPLHTQNDTAPASACKAWRRFLQNLPGSCMVLQNAKQIVTHILACVKSRTLLHTSDWESADCVMSSNHVYNVLFSTHQFGFIIDSLCSVGKADSSG